MDQTLSHQPTRKSVLVVLIGGFALVIILLLVAGFIGWKSVQSVGDSAANLVVEQGVTSRLLEEIEREQGTLNAVFYKLARMPETIDRDRLLSDLDHSDEAMDRIAREAAGTPDAPVWRELHVAALAFSAEARRLLSVEGTETLASRDLLRRHEEVISLAGKLVMGGYQKAVAAQDQVQRRSTQLASEFLLLLGFCAVLGLVCAVFTVRFTSELFRRMEWQTGELSRVSWHMLENQETTARRFSHELHDELGQTLTAVKANLAALGRGGEQDGARIEDCRNLVDEAVRNVREMSQLLHPTILDDFGLDAGLRSLCEHFHERTGIQVDYRSGCGDALAEDTRTHLFRIAQEALTNVARHSGAERVEISLRCGDGRVWLSICDNGRGLRAGAGAVGMGMIGMRARARSAGGEVQISSESGKGVAIQVWVPAKYEQHEATNDPNPVSR